MVKYVGNKIEYRRVTTEYLLCSLVVSTKCKGSQYIKKLFSRGGSSLARHAPSSEVRNGQATRRRGVRGGGYCAGTGDYLMGEECCRVDTLMKTNGRHERAQRARSGRVRGSWPSIHQTNHATIWSADFGGPVFQIALSISLTAWITVPRLITKWGIFVGRGADTFWRNVGWMT